MSEYSLPVPRIIGLGSYLPEHRLTNGDLEKIVETSDEWIVTRTGIKERRVAHSDEFPSTMGTLAAKQALANAGISAEELDMVIVATMTPDYLSPSTANLIQAAIGANSAASMDVQAACSGFIYGLSIAQAYIISKMYRHVLVIASEKMSAFIDYQDRATCVLFGDGAAAAVVSSAGTGFALASLNLGSDGTLSQIAMIPGGGAREQASHETVDERKHYFRMSGSEVFKHAIRRMSAASQNCLDAAGLSPSDISWLIPHQANKRIIEAMAKHFNMPLEKVYQTIHKYGNTSASSVAIALHELVQMHEIAEGEYLLLTVFGGGLTWGAALLQQIK